MRAAPVEVHAEPEYLAAFATIMKRIEGEIGVRQEPVMLCVCGGAALHLYTGARVSIDVDAAILAEFLPPRNLNVAYRGTDGHARLLYFDTQFDGNFTLMHPDAFEDSLPLAIEGIDAKRLDLRMFTPLDLAVTKLARFSLQDREDIATLARRGLLEGTSLRARALAALVGNGGEDADRIRLAIDSAVDLVTKATHH